MQESYQESEKESRVKRRDRRIRELYKIIPYKVGYPDEAMRVLRLNRQRERNHPGRIFVARELQIRRDIQRERMQRSTSSTS